MACNSSDYILKNLIVNDFSVEHNPQTWLCYFKHDDKNKLYDLQRWLKTGEIVELKLLPEPGSTHHQTEEYQPIKTPLNKKNKKLDKIINEHLYEERSLIEDVSLNFVDITLEETLDRQVETLESKDILKTPTMNNPKDYENYDPVCCSTPLTRSKVGPSLTFTRKKPSSYLKNINEEIEKSAIPNSQEETLNKTFELNKEPHVASDVDSVSQVNAAYIQNTIDTQNNENCIEDNCKKEEQQNGTIIMNNYYENVAETLEENAQTCSDNVSSVNNNNNNYNSNHNEGTSFTMNTTTVVSSMKKTVSKLPKPVNRRGLSKIPMSLKRN